MLPTTFLVICVICGTPTLIAALFSLVQEWKTEGDYAGAAI
jgi:hypothetical protein